MFFSFIGLIVVSIILLPNIAMLILPAKDKITSPQPSAGKLFDMLEAAGRVLCMVFPVISGFKFAFTSLNAWFWTMVIFIVLYDVIWIRYAFGNQKYIQLLRPFFFVPVPGAVFPVAAFLFLGFWIRSVYMIAAAIILGIGHITNSVKAYRSMQDAVSES